VVMLMQVQEAPLPLLPTELNSRFFS